MVEAVAEAVGPRVSWRRSLERGSSRLGGYTRIEQNRYIDNPVSEAIVFARIRSIRFIRVQKSRY